MFESVRMIAIDADDTLWENEIYFMRSEEAFIKLMAPFASRDEVVSILSKKEIGNLNIYGYGIKSFILSMMEAALELSSGKLDSEIVATILDLGKTQLNQPPKIIDGVLEALTRLSDRYPLILATKGDPLDQEWKLKRAELDRFFVAVEVMNHKSESEYLRMLSTYDLKSENFLMIGNSLKSDVMPVVKIGGMAIFVPHMNTWSHEHVDLDTISGYLEADTLSNAVDMILNAATCRV